MRPSILYSQDTLCYNMQVVVARAKENQRITVKKQPHKTCGFFMSAGRRALTRIYRLEAVFLWRNFMPQKLLRYPDVEARVGLSRMEIYRRIKAGDFPSQVQIGKRAVGFSESEVDHWVRARIAASKQA